MTTTTKTTDLKTTLRRLSGIGVSKTWLRANVLPEWWDDAIAATPAGLAQLHFMISRALGVPFRALADVDVELAWPKTPAKLKASVKSQNADLDPAMAVALQLAHAVAACTPPASKQLPASAQDLRAELLERDIPWIDFETLVRACWDRGIAVVHIGNWPRGWAKPDGMALTVNGQRVIVLCSAKSHPAWQLFNLAHEVGHHGLGHLDGADAKQSVIVDVSFDRQGGALEERDADRFALELICGDPGQTFRASSSWPSASSLASAARSIGRTHRIDPGHVVLNYANTMGGNAFFATANAALKLLPHQRSAQQVIHAVMNERLDWSAIGEESASFVQRLTAPADEPS